MSLWVIWILENQCEGNLYVIVFLGSHVIAVGNIASGNVMDSDERYGGVSEWL